MSCSIITGPLSALTGHLSSDDEDGSDKKKSKRGVLKMINAYFSGMKLF
jgi:hypothetical protein